MKMIFDPALLGILSSSRLPSARSQSVETVGLTSDGLVLQLEGRWSGVEPLSEHRKRAFMQLVDHIRGVTPDRSSLDFRLGLRRLDAAAIGMIDECALGHAYVATVTIALIGMAKDARGILPSTDFYWARSMDPAFWMMINGYGRPRHLAGIVGAFTHHAAERKLGHPMTKTYFDISAVEISGKIVLTPDEERLAQFEQDPHLFY
ncbi:hypothetical protein G6L37_34910 [Agrobacterium rubi]|nr:hypothetical protein [Agrobacterium rubi]NTF23760.1 hypothetical protein [Agrobacterium rubi]